MHLSTTGKRASSGTPCAERLQVDFKGKWKELQSLLNVWTYTQVFFCSFYKCDCNRSRCKRLVKRTVDAQLFKWIACVWSVFIHKFNCLNSRMFVYVLLMNFSIKQNESLRAFLQPDIGEKIFLQTEINRRIRMEFRMDFSKKMISEKFQCNINCKYFWNSHLFWKWKKLFLFPRSGFKIGSLNRWIVGLRLKRSEHLQWHFKWNFLPGKSC